MSKSTTNNVLILWPCLIDPPSPSDSKPNPKTTSSSSQVPIPKTQQKTFAQALSNVCDVPLSQLPQPCLKGDRVAIEIPEDEYLAGMDECKHALHGRIILPKGSSPLTVGSLRSKLQILWKSLNRWGVTSIGKGFYEFSFSNIEDLRRVRSVGSWALNNGFLKLFAWSPDFNPSIQQQTTAQVWIRIYGLSQEYWRKRILFAIASGVGSPICTDSITSKPRMERSFGHYVRVLVDMDLNKDLVHRILVERKGFAFFVDIEYETLPDFCTHCQIIGHHIDVCKRLKNHDANQDPHKIQGKAKVRQEWATKQPEVVNVVNAAANTPERNKDDVDLENEINQAIDADTTPKEAFNNVQQVSRDTTEFVDDTLSHNNQAVDGDSEESIHTKQNIAQQDINFLKESWAHLAGLEENVVIYEESPEVQAENQVIANATHSQPPKINNDVNDEGFQQVISRSNKKGQKPVNIKSSYKTRSKVGISNLLK